MVKHTAGVGFIDASARITGRHFLLPVVVVTAAFLGGCAPYHPAPIVHRAPVMTAPAAQPEPQPVPPAAEVPASQAPVAAVTDAPPVIETTPIPASSVESRPLPGPGGTLAMPAPAASSNLLKTEPKAIKQPYSDALLAELRGAAPASAAPAGPVTSATAATPAVPAASAPAPAGASSSAAASSSAPTLATAPATAPPVAPAPAAGGFAWPATGQVVQGFAEPRSMGLLIAGKPGDPILAAADGRVIFSGPGPRGYGNLVIVKHANETLSVYGHNRTLLVKEGQSVKRGQRIAELGSTGADTPQLRFEIRKDGKPVDPSKFLPAR
jgi:lipoprotein NlpD